jgi:hypothetical protein
MRARLGVIVLGVALACSVGPKPENVLPAHDPAGATVGLQVRIGSSRRVVTGELLAVEDSGLLVRDTTRIVLVRNRALRSGTLLASGVGLSFSGKPDNYTSERLRLLSRYPAGVSPDLLRRLLAAYGHDSLVTVP